MMIGELDDYVYATLGSEAGSTNKSGYRELTAAEARDAAIHWMQYSLAYPRFGSGASPDAVDPFFQVFSPAARYFTNQTDNPVGQWCPKTMHTFDAGIVAVDAANIGLLWFAEED